MKNVIRGLKQCVLFLLFSSLLLITIGSIAIAASDNEAQNLKRIVVSPDPEDQKDLEDFAAPVALPEGPTGYQKVVRIFEGVKTANPGVYWYQIDSLKWIAETSFGNIPANYVEDGDKYAPVKTSVRDQIQMADNPVYVPEKYFDQTEVQVPSNVVIPAPHIAKVETTEFQGKKSLITKLELDSTKTVVTLTSDTGKKDSDLYVQEYTKDYGKNPSGKIKYSTLYLTPLNITWRSKWTEQKKIRLTGTQRLKKDEEANLKGEVATMSHGAKQFGNWVDISTRSGVEWKSDQEGIVEVNPSGKIKGVSPGTATISVE